MNSEEQRYSAMDITGCPSRTRTATVASAVTTEGIPRHLGMLCLAIAATVGGCALPILVKTGGDVRVDAVILDVAPASSQPSDKAWPGAPAERVVVIPFWYELGHGYQVLGGYVLRGGQVVRYPVRWHTGWRFIISGDADCNREVVGLWAFTPGCWPALAHESGPEVADGSRGDAYPTGRAVFSPTFGREVELASRKVSHIIYPARYSSGVAVDAPPAERAWEEGIQAEKLAAVPRDLAGVARVFLYRRDVPWGPDVAANAGNSVADLGCYGAWFLRDCTSSLVEAVDKAQSLSDSDRLMVYRQALELVQHIALMSEGTNRFGSQGQLLRRRITELCRATGQKAPIPLETDEACLGWLKDESKDQALPSHAAECLPFVVDAGLFRSVRFMLEHGANPNDIRASCLTTPLQLAVRHGNMEVAAALLDAGANVNGTTRYQELVPLAIAAKAGNVSAMEFLMHRGADLHAFADQALFAACDKGNYEAGKFLLEQKANVDARDDMQRTPLQWACGGRDPLPEESVGAEARRKFVQLLLEHRANPNAADASGETPLLGAMFQHRMSVAQLLLGRGANINSKDANGTSLLTRVRSSTPGQEVIQFLVDHGAKE